MPVIQTSPTQTQIGFDAELGANWHLQFVQADGIPMSMTSFEAIDFGAISYKEVFQNVKTILATPLFSAALERTLGLDNTIVDRPITEASQITVAILQAVMSWEPRCEIMNIGFEADPLNGHLRCNLQLNIRNVIYGTNAPYTRSHIFDTPVTVTQVITPPKPPSGGDIVFIEGPPGPPGPEGPTGPTGAKGQRGSLWFTGTNDPSSMIGGVQTNDMYLNTTTAAIFQFDGTTWRVVFNGVAT